MRAKSNLDGYLFISPWLIGFLLLVTYPLLFSLWLSFRDITNLRLLETTFVGIDNYKDAFVVDVDFGPLILENLGNLLMDLPIIMVFSLGMALLVSQPLFGRTFFRAILFMPVVIGSAFVIQQLAGQGVGAQTIVRDSSDLENALAVYVGEGGLAPLTILVNRIVFVLWRSGVQILIFVAGLHSIPQHFYEAARVDGASNWGIFWKITLPLLSPFHSRQTSSTPIVDSFTEPFNTTLDYNPGEVADRRVRASLRCGVGHDLFPDYLRDLGDCASLVAKACLLHRREIAG